MQASASRNGWTLGVFRTPLAMIPRSRVALPRSRYPARNALEQAPPLLWRPVLAGEVPSTHFADMEGGPQVDDIPLPSAA